MGIKTQEKLELSTSYPQKVDNFTLTITFHIDVWVNPQLAEMLILERKNPLFRNIHLFSNKK